MTMTEKIERDVAIPDESLSLGLHNPTVDTKGRYLPVIEQHYQDKLKEEKDGQ